MMCIAMIGKGIYLSARLLARTSKPLILESAWDPSLTCIGSAEVVDQEASQSPLVLLVDWPLVVAHQVDLLWNILCLVQNLHLYLHLKIFLEQING